MSIVLCSVTLLSSDNKISLVSIACSLYGRSMSYLVYKKKN